MNPYPNAPRVLIGRKNLFPTVQQWGHCRLRSLVRAECSGEEGWGKSTAKQGLSWGTEFLISIGSVFGKWRNGSNYTNENEGKCDASHGDNLWDWMWHFEMKCGSWLEYCFGGGRYFVSPLDFEDNVWSEGKVIINLGPLCLWLPGLARFPICRAW